MKLAVFVGILYLVMNASLFCMKYQCFVVYPKPKPIESIEMQKIEKSICGICKQADAGSLWPKKRDGGTHKDCYKLIAPFEKEVNDHLSATCLENDAEQNRLFQEFAAELQNVCRPSIKEILEKKGSGELQKKYKQAEDTVLSKEYELRKSILIAKWEYLAKLY